VIDFVGADYFSRNLDVLAPSGRLVFLAALSGATMDKVDLSQILYKRLALKGTTLRARDELYQKRLLDAFEKEVLPLMKGEGKGGVQVMIHDVIPWDRVRDAHEMMEVHSYIGLTSAELLRTHKLTFRLSIGHAVEQE
jgi:NADPH:quinone reductase-like Zn-dependent oxidoreductase